MYHCQKTKFVSREIKKRLLMRENIEFKQKPILTRIFGFQNTHLNEISALEWCNLHLAPWIFV